MGFEPRFSGLGSEPQPTPKHFMILFDSEYNYSFDLNWKNFSKFPE